MTMSALTTTSATMRSWAEAARARSDGAGPATAAAAASTLSASDRSRVQHERLPVGLRPVTQQQLEARHGQRAVSAASLTLTGNARKASTEVTRAPGARATANGQRASGDEAGDGEDGGWKSVESRSSKWNRSHKQRGASPAEPSKRAASLAPASASAASASPALTPYAYSWATTSVASAAATNATNAHGNARTSFGARDDTASRRMQSYRPDPPLPPASALGIVAPPPRPALGPHERRSGGTPRGRGGGGNDSSQARPTRSGMRSPPLMLPAAASASDAALYPRTSLQQLLTKIETEQQQQETESSQSQHLSRRRADPTTSASSSSSTASSSSSSMPTAAAAGTNDQLAHDRRSAPDPGTKHVQQSQPPAQKCGDKRDFFFRNLEFETRNRLQIDDVAGFSVTEHEMATKISEAILALFYNCDTAAADPICAAAESTPLVRTRSSLTITDATACIGGNVISFCDYFAIVNAVECDRTRCAMLEHNLEVLQKHNAICIHASYLLVMHDLQQDVVFMDPPWGGPEYKDLERVDLFLDDIPLYDICTQLYGHAAIVVLKVPTNFDADKFAANVPGTVTVRTDLNKMHLVAIDFREARRREAEAPRGGVIGAGV